MKNLFFYLCLFIFVVMPQDAQSAPTQGPRGGDSPTFIRPKVYDYAPAILYNAKIGLYRMWWCGGIAGDHILHAESKSLAGPWHAHASSVPNSFDDVFAPTYNKSDFDGVHTCDPSVLNVGSTYYLYYGGYPIDGSSEPMTTSVGVATSRDGLKWTRASSKPLIRPARDYRRCVNKYGAGQPAAFYRDGYFHLAFTDTTGTGSNVVNGAGIYVWRSRSGTFASGVEQKTAAGWVALNAALQSSYSIADAFSIDWAWVPSANRVALARVAKDKFELDLYDEALNRKKYAAAFVPGKSHDGPGLVRSAWGHLIYARDGKLSVDILRGVDDGSGQTGPNGWDLGWTGADVVLPPS